MKHIKFIRHSKLEDPFTDYLKLTFKQVCDLATEKITPSIHSKSDKLVSEKITRQELHNVQVILCSDSNRTIQTATLIKKMSNRHIKIIKTENLSEIIFDPSLLTNQAGFNKNGFYEIRHSLFIGMKNGDGVESIDKILERITKLKIQLLNLRFTNVLCVTHSFYMRVLRLYFLENITQSKKISVKKLMTTVDHSYLEGFEVKLSI